MRLICSCVVTALSLTLFACGKTSTTKQSVSGSTNSGAGSTNPRITLENVKQIKQSMTLQEIKAILGEEPKSDGSAGVDKEKFSWTDAAKKSIHLTIQNDKVSGFVSFSDPIAGPLDNPKVTKENAAKIKKGMALQEVKAILGEPTSIVILFDPAKGTITTETYTWLNSPKQSSATIGFTNGQVSTLSNYKGP